MLLTQVIEMHQASTAQYGTLRFVIQSELHKRRWSNRLSALITTASAICLTVTLILVTYLAAKPYKQDEQVVVFGLGLFQQLIAGFTICTQTGYLT